MDQNQISLTALFSAYLRAFHSIHEQQKIFDDTLAYKIIPSERRCLIEQGIQQLIAGNSTIPVKNVPESMIKLMRALPGPVHVLSRAAFAEEKLNYCVKNGVTQYVILGAGMDTFAFRYAHDKYDLKIFELDHPKTQELKIKQIKYLGWEFPQQLSFIPIDFEKESLRKLLDDKAFDPSQKTFYSWLGVTMYLAKDSIIKMLRSIADMQSADSTIVFDFMDDVAFSASNVAARVKTMIDWAKRAGEPMLTGFSDSSLEEAINKSGWTLEKQMDPSEIESMYINNVNNSFKACEHIHFAVCHT